MKKLIITNSIKYDYYAPYSHLTLHVNMYACFVPLPTFPPRVLDHKLALEAKREEIKSRMMTASIRYLPWTSAIVEPSPREELRYGDVYTPEENQNSIRIAGLIQKAFEQKDARTAARGGKKPSSAQEKLEEATAWEASVRDCLPADAKKAKKDLEKAKAVANRELAAAEAELAKELAAVEAELAALA